MTKLIALVAIAALSSAGAAAGITEDIAADATFEVTPEAAEPLLTQGLAKLADAPLAPPPKAKSVKVRVLVACPHGEADDVVTLPADVAKAAAELGQVDSHKDAVAYALTLEQNQPK